MGKLTAERRKELEQIRAESRKMSELKQNPPPIPMLIETSFRYEIYVCRPVLKWVYENFPLDCKFTSAWIDWSKVARHKRWFPTVNPADKGLRLLDVVDEFQLKNSEVWTDGEHYCMMKTDLEYLLELYAGEFPLQNKYIWSETEKWVIEAPVVNADQDFSINFGYSDSFWKSKNDAHLSSVRGYKKPSKPYIDLSNRTDKN